MRDPSHIKEKERMEVDPLCLMPFDGEKLAVGWPLIKMAKEVQVIHPMIRQIKVAANSYCS